MTDPDAFADDRVRRTLERRVRDRRALHGAARDVIFRQTPEPGRMALSDFTDATQRNVTVAGAPVPHRLFHFVLACSGWEHVAVVLGGESFTALAENLQNALRSLGGAPREHRTDSLSAACRNRDKEAAKDVTRRHDDFCAHDFCAHDGLLASRCNSGEPHENGSVESHNRHLRTALDQTLILRGARLRRDRRRRGKDNGARVHQLDYRHVIHALRRKPRALAGSVYREGLFPRTEYAAAWDALSAALPRRDACRRMIDLLWLAHEQTCEAELAALIAEDIAAGRLPEAKALRTRLEPRRRSLPADTPVALAALERAERETRRTRRHLIEAQLPGGKTLATLGFKALPSVPRARVEALAAGDWIETGANLIAIGNSGAGKTHLLCAIGHALIEAGRRVPYTRATDLVQKLEAARRDLALEAALTKLDRFDLIILDDISYARKDQAETSVLFERIARRHETPSLAIAANQPFSAWDRVLPDQAVTVAAIDRLAHHATILEMNCDSDRRRAAADRVAPKADIPAATSNDNLGDAQDEPPADTIKKDVTA